jgi:hypothetical protein
MDSGQCLKIKRSDYHVPIIFNYRFCDHDNRILGNWEFPVDDSSARSAGVIKPAVEFLKRPKITVRLESSVIDFTVLMKSSKKDEQKTVNKEKQNRIIP